MLYCKKKRERVKNMKKLLLAVVLAVPMLFISASAQPPREGYELMFSDEFDGTKLNEDVWHYREDNKAGGFNVPDMVSVKDGDLIIRFEKKADGYYGGGVITNFGFGYGYYEVRSKLFGTTGGLHSSFWTAGVPGDGVTAPKYNTSIELDFYEVDSNKPMSIAPNFHYWLGGHLPGGTKQLVQTEDKKNLFAELVDSSADYFISGCEYLPDRVIWYINGEKVCEVYNYEMYGRPNLWLTALANTELSGSIDDSKLPGESRWDYFRFYAMPFKGENVVVNPSFDDNNRTDYLIEKDKRRMDSPAEWLEIGDEDAANVAEEDDLIRSGTGALLLGKHGAFDITAAQRLDYIGKGIYTFTAYIKNVDGADVEVFANDKSAKVEKTDGNYKKVVIENVDVSDGNAYIGIKAKGDTQFVYVDDVSLVCTSGTEEFNRKVAIEPCETADIPGEIAADNDNGEPECILNGNWTKSSVTGYKGRTVYANEKGASATFNMEVTEDGSYRAQLYKVIYPSSVNNAKCTLKINGKEIKTETVDLTSGDKWQDFGEYALKKGDKAEITVAKDEGGGYLRADCARLVPDGALKAQSGLVLKVGSRIAYNKNFAKRFIDLDNREIMPYINESDRTLVPLRFIAESLGAEVSYSEKIGILGGNDEITIQLGSDTVLFATGVSSYAVNGEKKEMDAAPENTMERTFVPLRVLAEAFSKSVGYDDCGIITVTDEKIENTALSLPMLNRALY